MTPSHVPKSWYHQEVSNFQCIPYQKLSPFCYTGWQTCDAGLKLNQHMDNVPCLLGHFMLVGCNTFAITDNVQHTRPNAVSMLGRRRMQWPTIGQCMLSTVAVNQYWVNVGPPSVMLTYHQLLRYNPDPPGARYMRPQSMRYAITMVRQCLGKVANYDPTLN